jgi:uncharacterized protein (DUF1800 family)
MTRSRSLAAVLALVLTVPAAAPAAAPSAADPAGDAAIEHVLNRLGYGPRPGDVEAVRRLGLDRYVKQQLHPQDVPENPLLARRLAELRTVSLDTRTLLARYDLPREAKLEIQKKRAEMTGEAGEDEARAARRELARKYRDQMDGPPRQVVEELQAAKVLRAALSTRQLDEVLVDFWMNHFNVFANKGPVKFLVGAYERDVVRARAWGRFEDLLKATAESPAMLFYLDNFLSVDPNAPPRERAGRGPRAASRRGGFGFARPRAERPRPDRPAGPGDGQGRRRGLNENYAREIMELHTLGVEGGYTQKDVTEVARCFTGWTIRDLRRGDPEFVFDERVHDRGDKTVLGQAIKGGGRDEGDRVIALLANHPSTARFVSYKLARRFVADEPPASLVARAAAAFTRTRGEIRAVVETIVTSPEFRAPEARQAKVKTPLEFVVSAVRASGSDVEDGRALARRIADMGMPLYLQQPPTGYKDTADAWVSTSGLLARMNFAVDLAGGRIAGAPVDPIQLGTTAEAQGQHLGSPAFQRR